jgi:7-carboxy-7-deazaguanine synthase
MQHYRMPDATTVAKLPVMEHFYTIQGEGTHAGKAAYFIRLAGCDVGCVWCDVKDSWEEKRHPVIPVESVVQAACNNQSRMAVITGGEPLMHDLLVLTEALHNKGFKLCLETSGAYPLSGVFDWICVSPKKFKRPLPEVLQHADELKVIIYNNSDFAWAEQHAAAVVPQCRLLLQPEYSRFEQMMPLIVDYVKIHPQWQISLQTHKIIHVP